MADEVFSGGVSVTGVEPGTTTIAIKSTTNPNISKKVPVTSNPVTCSPTVPRRATV